jgi:hypothetical protein
LIGLPVDFVQIAREGKAVVEANLIHGPSLPRFDHAIEESRPKSASRGW